MITDLILNIIHLFVLLIAALIGLLGDVSISSNIADSITQIKPYYMSLDVILPMAAVVGILAFDLVFEGLYFGYKLIRWSYQKIMGIT